MEPNDRQPPRRAQRPNSGMQEFSFSIPVDVPQGAGQPRNVQRPRPAPGHTGQRRPAQPQHTRPPQASRSPGARPQGSRPQQSGRPASAQRQNSRPPSGGQPPRRPAAPRRKRRTAPGGMGFFACAAAVILSLAWVITALIEAPGKRAAAQSLAAASAAAQSAAQQEALEGQVSAGNMVGPVYRQEWTMTPLTAARLALPENGRVEMSYFDDALFVGDSLTQGFQLYAAGAIQNAKYAAYVGAGPKTFLDGTVTNAENETVRPIDEILAAAPKKVYLLLGTNSMENQTDEALLKYYEEFLDFLIPQLPEDTVYYLQAIPPVSAEKMAEDENYTVARIQALNEALAQLAYERDLHFLDLYGLFADETGTMKADYTTPDGVHVNGTGYDAWREYLVTHTAYDAASPYLPGSPYLRTA